MRNTSTTSSAIL